MRRPILLTTLFSWCALFSNALFAVQLEESNSLQEPMAICVDCDRLLPQAEQVGEILNTFVDPEGPKGELNTEFFLEKLRLDSMLLLALNAQNNSPEHLNEKCDGRCGLPYVYAPFDLSKHQLIMDSAFPIERLNMMGFRGQDFHTYYLKAKDNGRDVLLEITTYDEKKGARIKVYNYPHYLLKDKAEITVDPPKDSFLSKITNGYLDGHDIDTSLSVDYPTQTAQVTTTGSKTTSLLTLDEDQNVVVQLTGRSDHFRYVYTQVGNLRDIENALHRYRVGNRKNSLYLEFGVMGQDYHTIAVKKRLLEDPKADVIITLIDQKLTKDFNYNKVTTQLNLDGEKKIKVGMDNLKNYYLTVPITARVSDKHEIDIDGESTFTGHSQEHEYTINHRDEEVATLTYAQNEKTNMRDFGISKDYESKNGTFLLTSGITYSKPIHKHEPHSGTTGVNVWMNFFVRF